MTWEELKLSFLTGIQASYDAVYARVEEAVAAKPSSFEAKVRAFLTLLRECKVNLERIAAQLPALPKNDAAKALIRRYQDMKALYDALVAGIALNATGELELGVVPVVVVGTVALSAAGVAWAIAAYEYAAGLRDETALMATELEARVQAMKDGKTLQTSTLTSTPAPQGNGAPLGLVLVGLGVLGGAAFFTFKRTKR